VVWRLTLLQISLFYNELSAPLSSLLFKEERRDKREEKREERRLDIL